MELPFRVQLGQCVIGTPESFERNRYVALSNLSREDLKWIEDLEEHFEVSSSRVYEEVLKVKLDDASIFFDKSKKFLETWEPDSVGIPLIEVVRVYEFEGRRGLSVRLAQFMILEKNTGFVLGD
jgi:hypothetical protein